MQIEIIIPGSKSITNRALILGTLTNKNFTLKNAAICDDTKYMTAGLKKLRSEDKEIEIYTGNAGTTTRFLTALSTLVEKKIQITGDKRMQERPISPLVESLNRLGAKIETPTGCPPLTVFPKKLEGGEISLPGNISSQYISALLMVAPFATGKTTINVEQELCSKPYVNMTIKLMERFELKVENKKFKQFVVEPDNEQKSCTISSLTIEGDASSASYMGAFAALNANISVLLKNIKKDSLQGDIKFLDLLEKMGCSISQTNDGTIIQGPDKLKALGELDMNACPDLVMTFAILAMFTPGKTKITNISNLRIKETDRIAALKNEIQKFGIEVNTGKDYIEITGNSEINRDKEISIETYNDHRIAMCFGLIKHLFPHLSIKDPDCVSKSYPDFWADLKELEQATK